MVKVEVLVGTNWCALDVGKMFYINQHKSPGC